MRDSTSDPWDGEAPLYDLEIRRLRTALKWIISLEDVEDMGVTLADAVHIAKEAVKEAEDD